jgi:acetyltransferase
MMNFAIVTHAGGPGVMLTDALSKGGLNVPKIEGTIADELKAQLFPGSSVSNPIDFLATGTPAQLGTVIDYCDQRLDQIDAIAVIYGTPGLTQLYEAYDVLDQKIRQCRKPIFPILPSMVTAGPEVADFLAKGHVNFSDEVTLATTLSQIIHTPLPAAHEVELYGVDISQLHNVIFRETRRLKFEGKDSSWLSPDCVREILACAGIPMVPEMVSTSREELTAFASRVGYPVVAKVVGPVHKSDVGGVALNIRTAEHLSLEFDRMMQIEGAEGVMVQKMLKGTELFIGAKYEERFGHVVLCGLGGIFVEVLKDVSSGLAPLTYTEAYSMIRSLRSYKIIKGSRGQKGINEQKYAEIIVRLSTLLRFATEIKEIDINPLLANEHDVIAVDARIRMG